MELLKATAVLVTLFGSLYPTVECSVFSDPLFSEQIFTDTPPDGYSKRTSLDDCVERFHTRRGESRPYVTVHDGDPVEPGEYSAFAAIGWTRGTWKIDYLCGGTLISLNYVLTAAHCSVDGNQLRPDTVRFGDVNLSSFEGDENAQQIAIKRFLKHPDYRAARSYHDIALIELEKNIEPGLFVCWACLWTRMDLEFDKLTVMGFGATFSGSELSPVLLKADIAPLDATECTDQFPKTRKVKEGIMDSQFCATSPTKDACPGDSGGPILVDLINFSRNKKVPFVAGIISIGTGCSEGSMGLYTRVASYIDWIQNVTGATFDPTNCALNGECSTQYKNVKSLVLYPSLPDFRVLLMNDDSDVAICGGALIDYRHVLTSADCVLGPNKPTFILHLTDRVNISETTVHPQWKLEGNNLAIITLKQFFNFETIFNSARPVCLWKGATIPEKEVYVAATGLVYNNRLVVNASIIPNDRCKTGLICSSSMENLIPGTCAYELGGPVSSYHSETVISVPYLYGINTEGSSCGGRGNSFKAVATAQHYTWIEYVVLKREAEKLDVQPWPDTQEYFVGSRCLPPSGDGVLGQCVPAVSCLRLMKEFRRGLVKIKTCLYEASGPIVCCPVDYL